MLVILLMYAMDSGCGEGALMVHSTESPLVFIKEFGKCYKRSVQSVCVQFLCLCSKNVSSVKLKSDFICTCSVKDCRLKITFSIHLQQKR